MHRSIQGKAVRQTLGTLANINTMVFIYETIQQYGIVQHLVRHWKPVTRLRTVLGRIGHAHQSARNTKGTLSQLKALGGQRDRLHP